MTRIAYALAGLVLACIPVTGGPLAPRCASIDAVIDSIPANGRHEVLTGPSLHRAVRLFNAFPPESSEAFDVVIRAEGEGVAVLFFGSGTLICARLIMAPGEIELVRLALFGEPA